MIGFGLSLASDSLPAGAAMHFQTFRQAAGGL